MGRGGSDLDALLSPTQPRPTPPSAALGAQEELIQNPSGAALQELLRWRGPIPATELLQTIEEAAAGEPDGGHTQYVSLATRADQHSAEVPAKISGNLPRALFGELSELEIDPDAGLLETLGRCRSMRAKPLSESSGVAQWGILARELWAVGQPGEGERELSVAARAVLAAEAECAYAEDLRRGWVCLQLSERLRAMRKSFGRVSEALDMNSSPAAVLANWNEPASQISTEAEIRVSAEARGEASAEEMIDQARRVCEEAGREVVIKTLRQRREYLGGEWIAEGASGPDSNDQQLAIGALREELAIEAGRPLGGSPELQEYLGREEVFERVLGRVWDEASQWNGQADQDTLRDALLEPYLEAGGLTPQAG